MRPALGAPERGVRGPSDRGRGQFRWRGVPHRGYGRAVSTRARQPVRIADAVATPQRRLLLVDGFAACALLEAPLAGISSEAVAIAPLVVVSLAALHLVAAVRGRRRRT
jgi:hypothetical protein